jgi:hypothetical protein
MMPWECAREQDVLDAMASRRWPDRDPEIAAHVNACSVCSDLVQVAAAFRDDQDVAWSEAVPLPSGEVIWWRAQVRARAEAQRLAARPITIVQGLGAAAAIVVVVAVFALGDVPFGSALQRLATEVSSLVSRVPLTTDVAAVVLRGSLLAVGVWLAAIPIAAYLTSDE